VANAIQSLPEAYREIVFLRDFEELTIDGIAERLELTREAVKARLRRARKLLREYLSV
jgi:RNA polymerase sigma factor (sigma-70 family)